MKLWKLTFIMMIALSLCVAFTIACGDDDDDDDDDDNDNPSDDDADADDDDGGDCTLTEVCEYIVDNHPDAPFASVADCEGNLVSDCAGDAAAFIACDCQCVSGASDWNSFDTCEAGCWDDHC